MDLNIHDAMTIKLDYELPEYQNALSASVRLQNVNPT